MVTKRNRMFTSVVVLIVIGVTGNHAGMDEFLRDSVYSIHSMKDDGVLTLTETPHSAYKMVTIEKWKGDMNQKWMVDDFQSMGRYHFTPLLHNTTSNVMTFQFTKNIYSYKRQWTVKIISLQRYQVTNPESGLCLTNMGFHKLVDEKTCDNAFPSNQVWKFRLLGR